MKATEVREICRQRLAGWTKKLVAEHATPVILLGIGHDGKSGEIVLCTTEDMSHENLELFVRAALLGVMRENRNLGEEGEKK
jgi:hypothetical protein